MVLALGVGSCMYVYGGDGGKGCVGFIELDGLSCWVCILSGHFIWFGPDF